MAKPGNKKLTHSSPIAAEDGAIWQCNAVSHLESALQTVSDSLNYLSKQVHGRHHQQTGRRLAPPDMQLRLCAAIHMMELFGTQQLKSSQALAGRMVDICKHRFLTACRLSGRQRDVMPL